MSVKVDLDKLADTVREFTFAYLITVGDDYRAHTVAVDPVFGGGRLNLGAAGGHTLRNLATHTEVTLVWPPAHPGGYSLIVDGVGHPGDETLSVEPLRAVLHRKASPGATTKPGCKDDCVRLEN